MVAVSGRESLWQLLLDGKVSLKIVCLSIQSGVRQARDRLHIWRHDWHVAPGTRD